jgi:hypothetical protein
MTINQNYEGQSQIRNAICAVALVAAGISIIKTDTEYAFEKSALKDLLREKVWLPGILSDFVQLFGDFAIKTGRIVVREKVQTVKRLIAEAIHLTRELPNVFQDYLKISSVMDRARDLERGDIGVFFPQPDMNREVRLHLLDLFNA